MKKNVLIGFLVLIILGLGGYLVYDKGLNKEEAKNTVAEEDKKEDMIIDEEDSTEIEENNYNRYTKAELKYENASSGTGIILEIKDGKLVETSNKGIEIDIYQYTKFKYFTYQMDCGGDVEILVLTENNELYKASESVTSKLDDPTKIKFEFKKIELSEKVKDITLVSEPSSCGSLWLGVVLQDGKIYDLTDLYDEKADAAIDTTYKYVTTIEKQIVLNEMYDTKIIKDGIYINVKKFEEEYGMKFTNGPQEGWFKVSNYEVVDYSFKLDDYVINYNSKTEKAEVSKNKILKAVPNV